MKIMFSIQSKQTKKKLCDWIRPTTRLTLWAWEDYRPQFFFKGKKEKEEEANEMYIIIRGQLTPTKPVM